MIWKGHVSFGLVNIPVVLHPAVTRDELDFTLLDARDRSPIGYRKVNKRTGQEVPAERITRGFQHRKGSYVIVTDDDLRQASPERTQRIDIRPDGAPQAERGATGRGASRQAPALAPRAAVGLTRSCRR